MGDPPPTLAYILKGYPRISETFISNEILLLEQIGFTLRLFSMRHPRESFRHDSVSRIQARVDYLPSRLWMNLAVLLRANGRLLHDNPSPYRQVLRTAIGRFKKRGKIATIKHFLQAGFLVDEHLRKDPSIVHLHSHFAHSPTSVALFTSMLSGLPFSFTAHAKDIYTSRPELLREKCTKAVFTATCTRYNKRYLDNLAGNAANKIHCLYHGIDLELFRPKRTDRKPRPPYQLLTVARITAKKGLPTVYKALKIVKERGLPFTHYLIGTGEERETIARLIDDLGLDRHCHLLGTLTHAEVLSYFEKSDLFILGCTVAKNGDRDGIPNVLVESLAMGVPAVATTVSALPEIIINGQTGLAVEPEDGNGMADAIITLIEDDSLRQSVIKEGLNHVHTSFDNSRLIVELAQLFQTGNPLLCPRKRVN
jgi:glycosyltransferase involved in cell wall biosynthesis